MLVHLDVILHPEIETFAPGLRSKFLQFGGAVLQTLERAILKHVYGDRPGQKVECKLVCLDKNTIVVNDTYPYIKVVCALPYEHARSMPNLLEPAKSVEQLLSTFLDIIIKDYGHEPSNVYVAYEIIFM
jgi:hypothetical protein